MIILRFSNVPEGHSGCLGLTNKKPIMTFVTIINKNTALLRRILFTLFGLVSVGLIVTDVTIGISRVKFYVKISFVDGV